MPGVSSDFLFGGHDVHQTKLQGGQSETKLKGGHRVHRKI